MVKAEIKKKDGTHIIVDGSEEEVKKLLDLLDEGKPASAQKTKKTKEPEKGKMSIGDMILELKEEKFFNSPKSLVEIKNALSENGGIYEVTTLSASLIRLVRKRTLGRIKQDNKWKYVKR